MGVKVNRQRMTVAVIGGGVAGITTAHILQRSHDVTLFEKNEKLGGHTNTVVIGDGPDAGAPVDTGFIVLNDRTYPTFKKLLSQLDVEVRDSDMSFGFYCERSGLQYSGNGVNGIFAQRRNAFRGSFLRMVFDVTRFNERAKQDLDQGAVSGISLGDYLSGFRSSTGFVNDYLLPMGAAIWSTPAEKILDFPAKVFLRFFANHGLLTLGDRPQWQTVVGGSHTYVKAFEKSFSGTLRVNARLKSIRREASYACLTFEDGTEQRFDRVVIATHADEALRLLADPTGQEQKVLKPWSYTVNHTVLHTDESVMPPNHRAWASWNYTREETGGKDAPLSITYHMNRLQGLKTQKQYFVTLNRTKPVDPKSIIREITYTHPLYSHQSVAAQKELHTINGIGRTFFCGSYCGYGFHEDAVKSGVAVARLFGLEL